MKDATGAYPFSELERGSFSSIPQRDSFEKCEPSPCSSVFLGPSLPAMISAPSIGCSEMAGHMYSLFLICCFSLNDVLPVIAFSIYSVCKFTKKFPSFMLILGRICKVPWMGYLKNLEYSVHEKPKFSTFAPS
jgi:hypothetical protein